MTSDIVSIVLLLKDGAPYLEELVRSLAGQESSSELELVVIDSGSGDGGVELLEHLCDEYGLDLRLSSIPPDEFGHGRTRNLAIETARGEVVAMLSQDALPESPQWLDNLVRPLRDTGVAGVFGRQIARPGTGISETLFYELTYPDTGRRTGGDRGFSNLSIFFSNVNGAVRRSLALAHPFRDDLVMSEDQFWGRAVLREGYDIVYEPGAAVLHSHGYDLRALFRRYFQSGYSLRQMGLEGDVVRGGASSALRLLGRVVKESPRDLPYAVLYQFVQGFAWLSGRYDLLPSSIRERLL
jgi:rhamnosyltransferase